MKIRKLILILSSACVFCGCGILANGVDPYQIAVATEAALEAATISDAQVIALSQRTVKQLDAENKPAAASYQNRLSKLLAGVGPINGMGINYQVYQTKEVNAFACGDGSIRVYSGLMDIMDDGELMAIIGHECGHVANRDTKKAMKNAYLTYAARNAIGAAGGTIGALSNSILGSLGESFISSKYSQKQEYAADQYGYDFAVSHGFSPYSMSSALEKLVKLSGGSQSSLVQKMFASHPDSAERAARMRAKADAATKKISK